MSLELTTVKEPRSGVVRFVELLFNLFLRALAIIFFAATLYSWLRVVGFWSGAENRFDTMSVPLQIFAATMVVLLPVVSVGLWTTLSWGRVVWFLAIGVQTVAILRFGDVLDIPRIVLAFHAISLTIYLCFQISLYFIDKKA